MTTPAPPCLGCGHAKRNHVKGTGLCLVKSCKLCLIYRPKPAAPNPPGPTRGSEIAAGDILVPFGIPHRITRIVPYLHPTIREPGWRIAYAGPGPDSWGITLEPQCTYEVA
jgi:hypothetical protein